MVLTKKVPSLKRLEGYSTFEYVTKRIFELPILLLLFPILIPLSIYSIYRIKKESKGSILFKQSRVGLNGKIFTCYKFRSMHEESNFNPYTQDDDKRIFSFGRTMRQMRIDELPQLWNVLKGEMHLIGPRAEWDILVNKYTDSIPKYGQRHLIRPGITGLAQVSYPYGRNINDAREKLKYDMVYIQNWSLLLELKISLKTIQVILGKEGI